MTLFQWIALSVLAAVLAVELAGLLRKRGSRWLRLGRCLVWAGAGLSIAQPEFLQSLASGVGIGRAADLVLYLFVLAFLAVSFAFYSRYVRLQRQITDLVRYLAIQEARRETGEQPS